MLALDRAIQAADDVQLRFNNLPPRKRVIAFLNHESMMNRITSKHRLGCMCTDCMSIMESFRPYEGGCCVCGSPNIVSEYYC